MAIYGDILDALLGERYRVIERLGAGAFGEVFKAQHESFGIALRTVALKLFTKAYVSREKAATVFREALLLEALAAESRTRGDAVHLITIHDIGALKDYQHMPYVAMEYVDGGTLSDQLRQAGRLPLQTVIRHIQDICAGLRLAHEAAPAIIHRDLKPENVLVTRSGFVKVADFGLAIDRYEAFLQGGGAGTISYAAPESRGQEPPSPAYDVYALGVMMVEMLLGQNPLAVAIKRAMDDSKSAAPVLDRAQDMLANLQDPETGK